MRIRWILPAAVPVALVLGALAGAAVVDRLRAGHYGCTPDPADPGVPLCPDGIAYALPFLAVVGLVAAGVIAGVAAVLAAAVPPDQRIVLARDLAWMAAGTVALPAAALAAFGLWAGAVALPISAVVIAAVTGAPAILASRLRPRGAAGVRAALGIAACLTAASWGVLLAAVLLPYGVLLLVSAGMAWAAGNIDDSLR